MDPQNPQPPQQPFNPNTVPQPTLPPQSPMTPTGPLPPQPPVGTKSKKPLIIILIIVFVLLVVAGVAAFVLLSSKSEKQNDTPAPVEVTEKPEEEEVVPTNPKCLVQTDFDKWYKSAYGKSATDNGFHFEKVETAYETNLHFKPNSLAYEGVLELDAIENIGVLAKTIKGKTYMIKLSGSYGSTDPTDISLADKRAEKVRKQLIAAGVPEDKIEVTESRSLSDLGEENTDDDIYQQLARSVVVVVDPTCN